MKKKRVSLGELRSEAKRVFGAKAGARDAEFGDVVEIPTGQGYTVSVTGHNGPDARRRALDLLGRIKSEVEACEVCKDVLESAPKRCEKHAHGDVSDYEVEP